MRKREPMEEWEKELERELETLPELEAPSSLLPRVMERIREPEPAAWYQSSWWQWPLWARTLSVLVAFAVMGGLGWLSGAFGQLNLWGEVTTAWAEFEAACGMVFDILENVLGSTAVFWREHGQIILMGTASLLLATYLVCVAAGTALYRFAWRRIL